jgi:Zn-dependent protease
MKWSYRIARVSGIDVKIHATFLLLLAWFAFSFYQTGGTSAALHGVLLILLLFTCVLLHEFGHAFAARAYGIRTPDITLLPIGGVARLERMPDNPVQELVVAVAGPAVNVFIALVLWIALAPQINLDDLSTLDRPGKSLLLQLLSVNIMLILFNLLPAFPMDGGRMLRAVLAMRMDHTRATTIAARIGQGIAVLFVIAGFFGNPFLILIGFFVFMGAQQEASYAKMKSAVTGLRVADAMITRFASLPEDWTIAAAAEEALHDTQPLYPLLNSGLQVTGIVQRNALLAAAGPEHGADLVRTIRTEVPLVNAGASFGEAFQRMQDTGSAILVVVNPAQQAVGLISLNLLSERSRMK